MTNDELKPCPFCGSESGSILTKHKPTCYFVVRNTMQGQMYGTTHEWNTRPIEDELRAEIELLQSAINKAIDIASRFGGVDGSHHKDWVIDQMVQALAGDEYERVVKAACFGEDGPDTYSWNVGIAP